MEVTADETRAGSGDCGVVVDMCVYICFANL